MRRIDAFNIEGRIGLGVTQGLGFLQHVIKSPAFLAHFGEDEVAGAVDDAGQPVDAVGRQTFTDRLDHRDTTGYGGFEGDDHAFLAGTGEDLIAVHGDQRLVCGDHMLAVVDGLEHQFMGQGVAADQLDNDIDFRVIHHIEDIVGQSDTGRVVLGLGRADSNLGNFNTATGTTGNLLSITLEYIQGAATDGAQPTDAYFHRFHAAIPHLHSKRPEHAPAA